MFEQLLPVARARGRVRLVDGSVVVLFGVKGKRARVWHPPADRSRPGGGHYRTIKLSEIVEVVAETAEPVLLDFEADPALEILDALQEWTKAYRERRFDPSPYVLMSSEPMLELMLASLGAELGLPGPATRAQLDEHASEVCRTATTVKTYDEAMGV